ncbi:MAG TPA: DUF3344 domain-containing protein [Candidatus Nanoarchaeia archaeon]|nr:DUF3344 domain-containing protein [Candidatus Nanoarchaeia archaeon]
MKIITIFFIILLIPLASAGEWRGEGTPLYTIAEGQIHGGIYVAGGHGLTYENPYVEYFEVPGEVEYARLYVPVWNYNEDDWLEVSINEKNLGRRSVPDYVAAYGIADYVYTVTDSISPGTNKVTVTYHNPNGGPYSVVMVAVYKDQDLPQTRYWIAEGNHAISRLSKDTSEVRFSGVLPDGIANATLYTMMIAGNEGEIDSLYFNSHLLGEDVGRRKSGAYFDLDSWDVGEYLSNENNTVIFDRGDEVYLHPFNAVLAVAYQQDQGEDYITTNNQVELTKTSIPLPVILILAASVLFFVYRFVRRK